MIENRESYKYAKDVLSGKIVACEYVKNACQRFLNDLNDERYYFNEKAANKFLKFTRILKLSGGQFEGKPLELMPWQHFLFDSIYGFYNTLDNTRKYNTAYVIISRKNAKSTTLAIVLLYGLLQQTDSQVIIGANSKEQAGITFRQCVSFAKSIDPNGKYFTYQRDRIILKRTNSFLRTVSSDCSKLDGYNISVGCIDEIEEARTSEMYDIIASSQGMQKNPLITIIGTAGFDKFNYGYKRYQTATEILTGAKDIPSQFCLIYTLDENDDYEDESVWEKANPSIDTIVQRKYLRTQVENAKNIPSETVGVKTKNFNIYCDSQTVWIPERSVLKSTKPIDLNNYKDYPCYVGVDLSSVSDLTAVSFMIPLEDGTYVFKNHYYLPESQLGVSPDREMYREWFRNGLLTATSGNTTDYDYITTDIMKYADIVNIMSISYDSWNATQWAIDATEKGLPLEPFSQSLGNFNRPTKELERLLLSGKITIDNNEITRFCFRNVKIKCDHNGNAKPSKEINESKIDGVIAMLQALGKYLEKPRYDNEIEII